MILPGSWPVLQPLFLPNTPSFEMLRSPLPPLAARRGRPRTFLAERGGERRGGGRQLGARTNARGEHGTAVGARSLTSDQ